MSDTPKERPCVCTGLTLSLGLVCDGCRANERDAAVRAERARIAKHLRTIALRGRLPNADNTISSALLAVADGIEKNELA